MAQLINNPLSFTVADVSAAAVFSGRMKLAQAEFLAYTSTSDTVEIQNASGQVIFSASGSADLDVVRSGKIGWVSGLIVPVTTSAGAPNIPSGKLIIYFE